jgi:tRNA G18 (ribose-2'-O)-methylase SpoU
MPPLPIADLDDPRIAVYRSLKATNQTRGGDHFIVEGEKLVRRLASSRFPILSILTTDRFIGSPLLQELPPDTTVFQVPFERIHDLVGFPFHRGVLGCGQRVPWPSCAQVVDRAGPRCTLVVCPRMSNPENLGAIARIGDVFGANAVVAGSSCPDPYSRRVLRVSMGAVLRLPVIVSDRIDDLCSELRDDLGVEFWAAVADPAADSFESIARPDRLALVLGDEDQGVDSAWVERCRHSVTIPMHPGANSLNVSVAAGILLYELTRGSDPG